MSLSIGKLVDGMPHPVLTRIAGVPDYEVNNIVNSNLIGNTVTVPTNLSCGIVGYTCLTLAPTI